MYRTGLGKGGFTQTVAYNKTQERIGDSDVFADSAFVRCGCLEITGRLTPTLKPAGVR